ncbi:MAG: DUF86 domain-containing protein [Candidatus Rokubacteria bacterium]|nr:DUF86 domain-containing protein [Candidatus Rokubacteria bacterium]
MSPVDAAVIRRKLARILASVDALRPISRLSVEEYRAELGSEVPEEYYGGFLKIGDLGIVSPDLARSLAPSAGLRNRLVHEYEAIDDEKVLRSIGTLLELYPRYVQALEAFLTKAGL